MADGIIQVAPDSTGKDVDMTQLTVGSNTVYRQRIQLGGSTATGLIEPDSNNRLPVTANPAAATGNSPTFVSVGVSSTSVLGANSSRKGAVFTNTSANTISFATESAAAVLNSGITLPPWGVWEMDGFTFTTGAIHAIASAASSNLAVAEFQ